jgi:putative ABC transport system ATP-binding protein
MRGDAVNPLELRQVSRIYDMGDSKVVALDHVELVVRSNEVVMLVGPSGSGKTTLLSIAGGLLSPSQGQVLVGGTDISRASARQLTAFRRERVGFIFQSVNLVPFLTARENLLVVAEFAKRDMSQARSRADRLLHELGLGHRMGNLPSQLSGGERQRVAIGRALMNQPALVLVDEPTSSLDSKMGIQVMELIVAEVKARGAAAVIVTHDSRMTRYGDRTMAMADGHILAGGAAGSGERLALPRYREPAAAGAGPGHGPPTGEWDRYGRSAPPAAAAAGAGAGAGGWDQFSQPAAVAPSGGWDGYDDQMVAGTSSDRYELPVAGAGSPSRNWYENPAAAGPPAGGRPNATGPEAPYRSPFEDLVPGAAAGEPDRRQLPAVAGPPNPSTGTHRRIDPRTGQHRPVGPGPGQGPRPGGPRGAPYGRPGPGTPPGPPPAPGRVRPPSPPAPRTGAGPAAPGSPPPPDRFSRSRGPTSGPPTGSHRPVEAGGPPPVRNGHPLGPPSWTDAAGAAPAGGRPDQTGRYPRVPADGRGPAGRRPGPPPPGPGPGAGRPGGYDPAGRPLPPPGAGRTGSHPAIPADGRGAPRPPGPPPYPAGRGGPARRSDPGDAWEDDWDDDPPPTAPNNGYGDRPPPPRYGSGPPSGRRPRGGPPRPG